MKRIFLIINLVVATCCYGQSFEVDRIEVAGNKVLLFYNLNDNNSSHQYLVNLYTSQDNFATPLSKVIGDVGTEVKPGINKKITWDITKELGPFKGDLSFKVSGRVFIPFVKLKDLNEGQVFKRGKSTPLVWTSGNMNGLVNIELYKGDVSVWNDTNQPNSGRYEWFVPSDMKKGNNYRLKFTNVKDRNEAVYSLPFVIKPKIPFLIKAMGVAVIGVGIAVLAGGKKGDTGTSTPTDTPLAPAPTNPN